MSWPAFVNWNFSTPIDDFETGSSPYTDVLTSWGIEGDLHIVTLQMWLPAAGAPDLRLGRTGFIDETTDWTGLPVLCNGDAYLRSWYRFATADMVAAGAVAIELSGYTPATEGGNVFLNVFRGAIAPEVVYQQAVSGTLELTPAESPNLPLLHHYFGRSAFDTANSTNPPIIQPFGRSGSPGPFTTNNGGITTDLPDGIVPGPPSGVYTDQYGAGFFYPRTADLPIAGGAYDGQITWDTQTATFNPFAGVDNDPLGPQTAVIQGLKIGRPPGGYQCLL